MTDTPIPTAILSDPVAQAVANATAQIEAALEHATPAPPTPDAALATATRLWVEWRNANLGFLPTPAFNRIESASSSLIQAIAAAL